MRTVVCTAVATALLGTVLAVPSSAAEEGTPCTASYDVKLTPGLSVTPTSGTFTTDGQSGTLTCTGPVGGVGVTGPGTWGETGRYGVTAPYGCTGTAGDFVQRTLATLPTGNGPVHLVADPTAGTIHPLGGGGIVGGEFTGPGIRGTYTALPLAGDCVTAPVTLAHIDVKLYLRDR